MSQHGLHSHPPHEEAVHHTQYQRDATMARIC